MLLRLLLYVTCSMTVSCLGLPLENKNKCRSSADCLDGFICRQLRCVTPSHTDAGPGEAAFDAARDVSAVADAATEDGVGGDNAAVDSGRLDIDTASPDRAAFDAAVEDSASLRFDSATVDAIVGPFAVQTVVEVGHVGNYSSLALDQHQRPHIAFYDATADAFDLVYASWTGNHWSIAPVDQSADVGMYAALQIDHGGRPHIAYHDADAKSLKYAIHDNNQWFTSTLDGAPWVGEVAALALDQMGVSHLSYCQRNPTGLRYASGTVGNWSLQVVSTESDDCQHTAIAVDGGGLPHILFGGLRYAHHNGDSWHISTVDDRGTGGDIDIDGSGVIHVAYANLNTTALYHGTLAGGWQTAPVGQPSENRISLEIDTNNQPHIAFRGSSNLLYAQKTALGWAITTVDDQGYTGRYASLRLDRRDLPHIAFQGEQNTLKYARRD